MSDSVHILGIRVDNLSRTETLERIQNLVDEGTPHHAVTVNPEFVVIAQQDATFKNVLNNAALALPDGVGLMLASKSLGAPLKERIPGVDLLWGLAKLSAEKGYRIFLLGGAEGVAEACAARFHREFGVDVVAGIYAGSPSIKEEDEIVLRIMRVSPHFLFVAYGAPQQDLWISRNLYRLGVPFCMGVGGSFDYISGAVRRAPQWMQRVGLEWLFRLLCEPWRWKRQLRLPKFIWLVLLSRLSLAKYSVQ